MSYRVRFPADLPRQPVRRHPRLLLLRRHLHLHGVLLEGLDITRRDVASYSGAPHYKLTCPYLALCYNLPLHGMLLLQGLDINSGVCEINTPSEKKTRGHLNLSNLK